MTQVTINDLTDLPLPMTGAEEIEIERAGVSYRISAGDLSGIAPTAVPIVTGAVSQNLDPLVAYYEVTTGGTAGVELLNLPNLPLDGNGWNGPNLGRLLRVALAVQTNPSRHGQDFRQRQQPRQLPATVVALHR